MREILFRGKKCKDGEWIYGYYIKGAIFESAYGGGVYEVEPETLGQYTEFDIKGWRVYDGDIIAIKQHPGRKFEVRFQDGGWALVHPLGSLPLKLAILRYDCKVVGTVYDEE